MIKLIVGSSLEWSAAPFKQLTFFITVLKIYGLGYFLLEYLEAIGGELVC
jgi:hypothetical protein